MTKAQRATNLQQRLRQEAEDLFEQSTGYGVPTRFIAKDIDFVVGIVARTVLLDDDVVADATARHFGRYLARHARCLQRYKEASCPKTTPALRTKTP